MLGAGNVTALPVLLVRVIWAEVLAPGAALKITEVVLGVSVPPLLDVPYVYDTLTVPVVDGVRFVEVRVTVALYVRPFCIPCVRATEKYKVVGVVNVPVTLSQF